LSVQLAVSDAHALIWYARGRTNKLGRRARTVFEAADAGRAAIYVPTIALVEVLEASRAGIVELAGGSEAWVQALLSTASFFPVALSVDILLKAEELYAIPERSDRLIAATAALLDTPLITRDLEIERAAGVEVIW
jgi:PIN domain nuclease of toxin-antitoxin system